MRRVSLSSGEKGRREATRGGCSRLCDDHRTGRLLLRFDSTLSRAYLQSDNRFEGIVVSKGSYLSCFNNDFFFFLFFDFEDS